MPVSALSSVLVAASVSRSFDGSPSEIAMRKSAGKRRGFAGFSPHGCGTFLRERHPIKTAQGVEADAGIPARTVERWLTGDVTPSVPAFARLFVAYGPAFLAAAVPGVPWIERAAALADHDAVTAEIAALRRRQARSPLHLTRRSAGA